MIVMSDAQKKRIEVAADALWRAREANQSYAIKGFLNNDRPKPLGALKQAQNAFWRACHALLLDEGSGPEPIAAQVARESQARIMAGYRKQGKR